MSQVADCGQPDAIAFTCSAVVDAGFHCDGVPIPSAPNSEALLEASDQDASYPQGCTVTFPVCNNGQPPYCTCGPPWQCYW